MKNKPSTSISAFASEVQEGLTTFPKYLSSKYIYDKKGDQLFQDIMAMPEYYLTDCEFNILEKHSSGLANYFKADGTFDLIELGAGDGKKTKILLRHLAEHQIAFDYLPIDISQNVLVGLENSLKKELPNITVTPMQGTYFKVLEKLAHYNTRKKVILFLGSNIGNLRHKKAISFFRNIKETMEPQDMLFMGFDQKKDPETILNAYSDPAGITEAFNKNQLYRINEELGANFEPDTFMHWETYNPETGTAESFLISKKEQSVAIDALELEVHFKKWETIHCEISQKYDDEVVAWLADEAGLKIIDFFTDDRNYYKDYIFQKK